MIKNFVNKKKVIIFAPVKTNKTIENGKEF